MPANSRGDVLLEILFGVVLGILFELEFDILVDRIAFACGTAPSPASTFEAALTSSALSKRKASAAREYG